MKSITLVALLVVSAALVTSGHIADRISIDNPCQARCLIAALRKVKPDYPKHADWFQKVEEGLEEAIVQFDACNEDEECLENVRKEGRTHKNEMVDEMIARKQYRALQRIYTEYKKCPTPC